MTQTTASDVANVQALWHARKPAPSAWLFDVQHAAIEQFADTGFPSTGNEDWKYTDVSKLALAYREWLQQVPAPAAAEARTPLAIPDAIHLVFVDGIFQPGQSSRSLPAGLLVGDLGQLAQTHADVLAVRFSQLSSAGQSAFVALNTAFTTQCTALVLPANTQLTRPIYIEYWGSSEATSCHPRLLVDLGAGSNATIVEHYAGNAATLVNAVAELNVGRGARLRYYRLQEAPRDAWHTAVQNLRIDSDARVDSMTIDCGATLGRNELHACLAGPGATLEARGLMLADGTRHIDSRITVEHAAPHTTSRERYRAILADKSRGVFNGRILVQPHAQKTDAALSNRNLLLSRGAEIDSKPELEIYADDVKCAHGSTTGQLDETALFYLLSRGIDMPTARNLLVTAFASELLTDTSITAVADRTREALASLRFSNS